jgi:hypothetical protein
MRKSRDRDPAHSFDAVHYKIQSYSLQLDPVTQYAGEIGSQVSANHGEYPIAIRIYQPCEHLLAKGARKQNPKYRIEGSSFGVFLMFGHLNLFRISDFEFRTL